MAVDLRSRAAEVDARNYDRTSSDLLRLLGPFNDHAHPAAPNRTTQPALNSSKSAFEFLEPSLADDLVDSLWSVLVDRQSHMLSKTRIVPSRSMSTEKIGEAVVSRAIAQGAAGLILASNKRPGTGTIADDRKLADYIVSISDSTGLQLVDYLVIEGAGPYSLVWRSFGRGR